MSEIRKLHTDGKPVCLEIAIEVKTRCRLRVVAKNSPKTGVIDDYSVVFYDREFEAVGTEDMEIRLPQSCKNLDIVIICDRSEEDAFRITKWKKKKLVQHPQCYNSKKVRSFVKFAQVISEGLAYLPCGEYKSINGEYTIQILENIEGADTPARIHNDLGFIQLSKSKMGSNTIPMNMAILLHEFSHFYMNEVQEDEIEADMNGLKIYLGLGYPIYESHKSFIEVFVNNNTPQNRERYDYIFTFVENFQKLKHKNCR